MSAQIAQIVGSSGSEGGGVRVNEFVEFAGGAAAETGTVVVTTCTDRRLGVPHTVLSTDLVLKRPAAASIGLVLFDFDGDGEKRITVKTGASVVVEYETKQWAVGMNEQRKRGFFPASYVRRLRPDDQSPISSTTTIPDSISQAIAAADASAAGPSASAPPQSTSTHAAAPVLQPVAGASASSASSDNAPSPKRAVLKLATPAQQAPVSKTPPSAPAAGTSVSTRPSPASAPQPPPPTSVVPTATTSASTSTTTSSSSPSSAPTRRASSSGESPALQHLHGSQVGLDIFRERCTRMQPCANPKCGRWVSTGVCAHCIPYLYDHDLVEQ